MLIPKDRITCNKNMSATKAQARAQVRQGCCWEQHYSIKGAHIVARVALVSLGRWSS